MSIKDRLEDADLLSRHGRKEGALVLVLVAVAATSRRRYPKKKVCRDGEAFKRFIRDEMATVTGGPDKNVAFPFDGKQNVPLEDILYTHLRCQLFHEGEMPGTIVFTQPKRHEGRVCNVLHLTQPLGFPEGWVDNLAKAVREAPENRDLFRLNG